MDWRQCKVFRIRCSSSDVRLAVSWNSDSNRNQQKGVQQETAHSACSCSHMYPRPLLYPCFMTPFGSKIIYGRGYIHMIIHYNCTRQFIVALLFADLLSISPSFYEMIFILVPLMLLRNWGRYAHTLRTHAQKGEYSCALAQTAPLLRS